ncbi:MAG: C10 family peptidase [Planctomycetota bacterium]|nr:C10 family peptidase [Planctomycetota bacterium]
MRKDASRCIGGWARALAIILCVLFSSVQIALADSVDARKAEIAAKGRLNAGKRPLGTDMPGNTKRVDAFKDADGMTMFYVVSLQPEGFVVTSADDWIEPIIVFSPTGTYDPSPENPLVVLLNRDLKRRVDTVRLEQARSGVMRADSVRAKQKWAELGICGEGGAPIAGSLGGVSEVRVAPLIQSKWSQSSVGGQPCYNYYTPNGYVCGCVATAMAQLMRYYQYPPQPVNCGPYTIYVSGTASSRSLRGGDGSGGAYQWTDMVLIPTAGISTAQREAIGAICHDAGVSAHMQYASGGSGAYMSDAASGLTGAFGYANAIWGCDYSSGLTGNNLYNMVNTNLDGGLPTLFGIYNFSAGGGHAIVCDGYGRDLGTWYHHLNMGWAGSSDAWYNLPTVLGYNVIGDCIYNIRTAGAGEVISGRITSLTGGPVADAVVTATRTGGGIYQATTNASGIYALVGVPSGSQYYLMPSKSGCIFSAQTISTGSSANGTSTCGNKWGIDFVGTTSGALLVESDGSTQVAEAGAMDSYTIVLATQPTANVVITVTPDTEVTAMPTTLTFTPDDWNLPQNVVVAAVDDSDLEWDHVGIIAHAAASSDPAYAGVAIAPLTVLIADDDSSAIIVEELAAGAGGMLWGNGSLNPEDPFNTYYEDSRAQTVILASELSAAGLTPSAKIVQLGLHCYQKHGRPNLADFRIRMQHTASSTCTSFTASDWTDVFGPTGVVTTTGEWTMFNFTTPFTWNGTSNIYIDLTRDDNEWLTNGGMYVRTGLPNRTFAGYADSMCPWPFDSGLYTQQQGTVPEMRFGYMSGIVLHTLTWNVNFSNRGTISRSPAGNNPATPSTNGSAKYEPDTEVIVTANAAVGYQFVSWTGPVANPAALETTVTMNSSKSITASFADSQPPQIEITGPTSEEMFFTAHASVNVAGTASDNEGIVNITWHNAATGASGVAQGSVSWTIPDLALRPGVNLIQVAAWDTAGLCETDAIQVVRETKVHWLFNEGTGAIATDALSGCVGTLAGANWLAADSLSPAGGACLHFDGDDVLATDLRPAWGASNEFTACAWVRTVSENPQTVFGFDTADSGALWLRITGSAALEFGIRDDAGTQVVAQGECLVSDGDWHHVACRRRMDAHMCDLFVDGELCASVPDITAAHINVWPQKSLVIGALDPVGPLEPFSGDLDSVRFYASALSDGQIAAAAAGVADASVSLAAGWNLISLPLEPLAPYSAESLAQEINAQGGLCTQVMKWNPGWLVHPVPSGTNDFEIELGFGYFVLCSQPSTLTVTGLPVFSVSIQLNAGWTVIGVPLAGHTAEQLGQVINAFTGAGNCTQIMKWNPGWLVHPVPSGTNNFDIEPFCGYFVKTTAGGVLELP